MKAYTKGVLTIAHLMPVVKKPSGPFLDLELHKSTRCDDGPCAHADRVMCCPSLHRTTEGWSMLAFLPRRYTMAHMRYRLTPTA